MVALSKSRSFKAANLGYVNAESEVIRKELNKGMTAVTELDAGELERRAMKTEMFKRVFPMIIKDRYPKASLDIEGLMKYISEDPKFGSWTIRGITEDHFELRSELEKNIQKTAKELISADKAKGFATDPERLKRIALGMENDFDRQLSLGSEVHDFLANKQLEAEAKLVEDVEIVVTDQITDHVAQLETHAIDAAEQKVETAVDSKVADVVSEEEERLITDTEVHAKGLVREGERVMEQEVVIAEDAAIKDVRVAEDGKKLL